MRRFPISRSAVKGRTAILSSDDARHLVQVLRLGVGDPVRLFDGAGMEYDGRVASIVSGQVAVDIDSSWPCAAESPLELVLLQAFLKEKKMDRLVRQATELGVARFVPVLARRSVARPDSSRLAARMARWEKIAIEALKQCRRGRIPVIGPVLEWDPALALAAACDLKIVFWEQGAKPIGEILAAAVRPVNAIALLLGPEGGFGDDEIAAAHSAGFATASLGPRILRAETATVAACAVVQHRLGDL